MKGVERSTLKTAFLLMGALPSYALADLSDLTGTFSTELEENAAVANQATYDQLSAAGCSDSQINPTASCGGLSFISWQAVRELVHTANEIAGSGSTLFSLGLDIEGLGFSLRWTAGEEFSAQGDMANNFVGGQLSGLASRISALRFGGSQISVNHIQNEEILIASKHYQERYLRNQSGGSAGEQAWSPWGSFINTSYSYGNRDATEREDAFDFDGMTVNAGVDYRLDNHHVVGVMFGYQEEEIDFDSSLSIVDGGVEMDAYSINGFYLYQSDLWYANASLGYQVMDFDMDRSIRYPSLNPDVDSTDTSAVSDTEASAYSISSTLGMTRNIFPSVAFDTYAILDYRKIDIDGYEETDLQNDGFNFVVDSQGINSFETAVGIKLQHVWASTYGVFIPYLDLQLRKQHKNESRNITAYYFNASEDLTDLSDASFVLPTDEADSRYRIYTIGLSTVLRGARQYGADSAASGGIQAFVNVRLFDQLEHFKQTQISGGLRYEF